MTGLEKIIGKIAEDTNAECEAVIKAAEIRCESISEESRLNAEKASIAIESEAKAAAAKIISIAESSAAQQKRQTMLAAKVEVINNTLDKVTDCLKSLPAEQYFFAVIKVASRNAMAGKCKAILNSADLARVPSDFGEKLSATLSAKGAECTLSEESANIGSGILLDYGDIVINCSFEAVVEENADIYKEKISRIIF